MCISNRLASQHTSNRQNRLYSTKIRKNKYELTDIKPESRKLHYWSKQTTTKAIRGKLVTETIWVTSLIWFFVKIGLHSTITTFKNSTSPIASSTAVRWTSNMDIDSPSVQSAAHSSFFLRPTQILTLVITC